MGLTIYQICNIDKDLEPQAVMPNPNISNDDLHKTINQFRELIKSLRKSTYTFTYNDDPVSREEFFKYIDYRFAAPYAILMDKKMLARYLAGESHFSSKKRGLNYYVILPNEKIRLDKWLLSKIESKQKKRIIIISFLSVSPGSSR